MSAKIRATVLALWWSQLLTPVRAQDTQITPPQSAPTGPARNSPSEIYRLKVQVQRVVLDVVVTDANGGPVEGLNQGDFRVIEDGVEQQVRSFDANGGPSKVASQRPLGLRLPLDTFSNLTLAPLGQPATVLLYDMLHTPENALPFAHQQLERFIKDRKQSTQVAVFVLTDRLHMLQGFTDDETRLMQAVNSKGATSQARILRDAPLTADASEALMRAEMEELIHNAKRRNGITVDAFIEIGRFLASISGRKNLIWLSGSFPPEIFPDHSVSVGDERIDAEIRSAQKLLRESRVAIYPVDVRGLQADPQFSAANNPTGPSFMPLPNFFGLAQASEHATMDAVAESTGGQAFYSTNGLEEAMAAAVRQGSEYYTLTYAPTNPRQDGAERKVKVVLSNPGYKLAYRTRYLAPDGAHPAPERPLAIDANMQHGAPNSSELFFEAKVVSVGGLMQAAPDEAQALRKFSHTRGQGKRRKPSTASQRVQHYDINFAILGRLLEMPPADDERYATDMRFALAAYTQEGDLLNGTEISFRNSIPETQYRKIESEGYHASMVFAVPEGAASLRVGVREEIGGRTGTVEVPLPLP